MSIYTDAQYVIQTALAACQPDAAVRRALEGKTFSSGKIYLVAAGKAAWQMASCAAGLLGERLSGGVVVTKYDHSKGEIPGCTVYEGGHPVPDENSFRGTQAAIDLVTGLQNEGRKLFTDILTKVASAIFIPLTVGGGIRGLDDFERVLACGADIVEMNTIRKRMSRVKGGKFAQLCAPAQVYAIVLSDILGDPLDMIASGPAYPDRSTREDAWAVVKKYGLELTEEMKSLLDVETPKQLDNVETVITGSVRELCEAAAGACREKGYETVVLTDLLCCQAREAGSFLASIAKSHENSGRSLAFLAGGETVVRLTGSGLGGRNQELALAAAPGIAGMKDTVVFSVGSDGTDGPTDAAGGMVDGQTEEKLTKAGLSVHQVLGDNDAYHALERVGGLIHTGPTGTNVNDVAVVLLKR